MSSDVHLDCMDGAREATERGIEVVDKLVGGLVAGGRMRKWERESSDLVGEEGRPAKA